jgi:hypothetical protein
MKEGAQMATKFYPLPWGHIEVRVDQRPARSARPRSGPVEGDWGNREVPPTHLDEPDRSGT